jgi:hypothetical protein
MPISYLEWSAIAPLGDELFPKGQLGLFRVIKILLERESLGRVMLCLCPLLLAGLF